MQNILNILLVIIATPLILVMVVGAITLPWAMKENDKINQELEELEELEKIKEAKR